MQRLQQAGVPRSSEGYEPAPSRGTLADINFNQVFGQQPPAMRRRADDEQYYTSSKRANVVPSFADQQQEFRRQRAYRYERENANEAPQSQQYTNPRIMTSDTGILVIAYFQGRQINVPLWWVMQELSKDCTAFTPEFLRQVSRELRE
jgi:hypothetical protein